MARGDSDIRAPELHRDLARQGARGEQLQGKGVARAFQHALLVDALLRTGRLGARDAPMRELKVVDSIVEKQRQWRRGRLVGSSFPRVATPTRREGSSGAAGPPRGQSSAVA